MRYLDNLFLSLPLYLRLVIIALLMASVAFFAIRKRQLTGGGTFAAVVVGTLIFYMGCVSALVQMLFFFFSATIISKIIKENKAARGIQKKGSRRDAVQVLANSLPSLIGLAVFYFSPLKSEGLVMFSAAIAEAASDTWSGEIGVLSKDDPVSIITGTRVPKGLSGGVSALGCFAALVASFIVGLLNIASSRASLFSLSVITVSGTLGSLLDSLLGATVQVHYRKKDGSLTEKEYTDGERNERARGIPFVTNDTVNLLSGLFSVFFAFTLCLLF